jgi:hypothetical protein
MPSALRSPDFESVSRRGVAALNALAAEFADGELTDDVCLACRPLRICGRGTPSTGLGSTALSACVQPGG